MVRQTASTSQFEHELVHERKVQLDRDRLLVSNAIFTRTGWSIGFKKPYRAQRSLHTTHVFEGFLLDLLDRTKICSLNKGVYPGPVPVQLNKSSIGPPPLLLDHLCT